MKKSPKKIPGASSTRREFLKKSTLAAAAVATVQNIFKTPVYGQSQAPSPGSAVGANNRIVVGYIGVGFQGNFHVQTQQQNAAKNNIAQAAVCDLSDTRLAKNKEAIGGDCKTYKRFEELLERKDIDAVTIATVDQWHADAAIASLEAGKHVYLEKPMARYLPEAFKLYDTVKRTGKVFQIGSQGCSDAKWQTAADLIAKLKIGPLILGQDSYMRNNPKGEWNTAPYEIQQWADDKDIDWVRWQGNVKNKTPFSAEAYFRWRKFYPYCAGPLGDLFPHRLHPLMLATGNPEFPSRVASLGQNPVHTDRQTPHALERDCPEDVQMIAQFPSGLALIMTSSTVTSRGLETEIRAQNATLLLGGNRVEVRPEKEFDDIDPQVVEGITPIESVDIHEANWFDCIRTNATPHAHADLAIRVQTVISLSEMSNRLNMVCLFDEKTRTITNGEGKEVPAITYGTLEKS